MKSSSKTTNNNRNNRRNNTRRNRFRQPQQKLIGDREFRTKLTFGTTVVNTSGANAQHLVRGNSAYNPAVWESAVRPALGFQQLADLYNRYECKASRIEVTLLNKAGSTSGFPPTDLAKTFTLVVFPSPYVHAPASLQNALEQPGARYVTCSPPRTTGAVRKMTFPWVSTREMIGTDADDEDFKAGVTQNPESGWLWQVCIYSLTGSQLDVACMIKAEYDTLFYDRARVPPAT